MSFEKVPYSVIKPVEKEGWLEKLGAKHKSFKKRWICLKSNIMYYYTTERDGLSRGGFSVNMAKVSEDDKESKKPFTFQIVTSTRTYLLVAPSQEEMDGWVTSLNECVARGRGTDSTEGPKEVLETPDVRLSVRGMVSQRCRSVVLSTLKSQEGVIQDKCWVDLDEQEAGVFGKVNVEKLVDSLEDKGYLVSIVK